MQMTMKPGELLDAAWWVVEQVRTRNAQISALCLTPSPNSEAPQHTPDGRKIAALRMGTRAFEHAQQAHKSEEIWAVDYFDGIGPRVRIAGLIAEPSDDLPAWAIELD